MPAHRRAVAVPCIPPAILHQIAWMMLPWLTIGNGQRAKITRYTVAWIFGAELYKLGKILASSSQLGQWDANAPDDDDKRLESVSIVCSWLCAACWMRGGHRCLSEGVLGARRGPSKLSKEASSRSYLLASQNSNIGRPNASNLLVHVYWQQFGDISAVLSAGDALLTAGAISASHGRTRPGVPPHTATVSAQR